eukprot:5344355-Alexandrium_andersonii.AAC.1
MPLSDLWAGGGQVCRSVRLPSSRSRALPRELLPIDAARAHSCITGGTGTPLAQRASDFQVCGGHDLRLSLIHISEPTRLALI